MPQDVQTVQIGDRRLKLTHLDKVLHPETGTTKAELLDYVARVADPLLAQLRDRPVTRIRWPHGVGDSSFFEKNAPKGTPDWVRTVDVTGSARGQGPEVVTYPVLTDVAGLIWVSNLSALELHVPQWRVGPRGAVKDPDRLVIDLDPGPGAGLAECSTVARWVAERLADDGLATVPVTSGSKGLQLYAAVSGTQSAEVVRDYAHRLADGLAADHRDLVVSRMTKSLRPGKVFLDWSQNTAAKTTIAPYSWRGRDRPSAAAPRRWEELGDDLTQATPRQVLDQLTDHGDLMAAVDSPGPRLPTS